MYYFCCQIYIWVFLGGSDSKRLPTMWETWVQSLGQEDLLEKEMATHSSILAWKIPWMVELSRWQSVGSQRVGHNWATSRHFTSSAFSKTSLNIWKFMVHILLKPVLENFEHYFTNVWDEYNCAVLWAFFGIASLWDWNENCSLLATAKFSKFAGILSAAHSQHHLSGCEIAQLVFHHLHYLCS